MADPTATVPSELWWALAWLVREIAGLVAAGRRAKRDGRSLWPSRTRNTPPSALGSVGPEEALRVLRERDAERKR